jgi:uncharacterized membrane protein YphA (DoxX/SURF4 family)
MQPQMELAAQPEQSAPDSKPETRWNPALKIGFRFAFCYFGLFCFPFPIGSLPYTEKPAEWFLLLWHTVVPWFGQHLLRLAHPVTIFTNGSGDTTYDYVSALFFLLIAVIATIVWSVLDRKRANYSRLHQWLRLYIRLTLGVTLLGYGGLKVIPAQFSPPGQWRYLETYGESSPMGLLWTFMGASQTYTIFAGAVEMLGGILLYIPKTVTLGALVSIGAMANVFILNMSYDVPAKLYSFHLLLLAAFLVLPEMRRLASFFVLNRPTPAAAAELVFQRRWADRGLLIAQLVMGLYFGGYSLYQSHQQRTNFTDILMKPPLFGVWSVDEFVIDGQPRPPLLTDETRWQRVIFDYTSIFIAQDMDSKLLRFAAKLDTAKKTFELTKGTDKNWKGNLSYETTGTDTLLLDGQLGAQKIHIKLHRMDGKYLLNTRGFHWINEYSYNR